MDYNDTNIYTYFAKPYNYGWMVYHVEDDKHVMDMCYATEDVAKHDALCRNMREVQRAAEAKERIESFKTRFPKHNTPYYSITGYYGD